MKNVSQFIFLSFLFAGIGSCKKETPNPQSNPPVFYFKGNVGTGTVDLEAGENNYYMYSNFNQDANNVYNFNGTLSV